MKAWSLDRYEKGGAFRFGDWPEPVPGDADVVIEIGAAGLNQLDSKIRDGAFKPLLPYRPPVVLGHDVAGRVTAVGPAVQRFKVGDVVYARPRDGRIGGFAQRIAVDQADVARAPANLSVAEAASIPLVGLTVWQALVEVGQLKPGQKVFIQAGSGGVGTLAIQLAKHLGATVATTTSAANADLVRGLGADVVIDYHSQDFATELSGYDLVLHSLDPATLERSLQVLKPGGKLISLSGPPDPAFDKAAGMNWLMRGLLGLMSRRVRHAAAARGVDYAFLFMRANGAQLEKLTALFEAGTLRPVIDQVLPFEDLNAAFARLDSGRARGKIVVAAPEV